MLAIAFVWEFSVLIWSLLSLLGVVHATHALGWCMLSAIPIIIYDVVAYLSNDRWFGVLLCSAVAVSFVHQIFGIFG